ncbi:CopG family transcriptional regulator [Brevibacillus centrosporus]|uniref:ribbon-helix-helix domain-containing protein n=1 Tax=Brevibacillus centrosporus TaxID=54910 RepID=UPI0039862377
MFERRRRNLDLTGTKGQSRREESSHGINWEAEKQKRGEGESPYGEDVGIESGWEETEDEPSEENLKQHPPIGRSRLAFSERPNVKKAISGQSEPSYPGLQKKPDFYEQHKKLTIYLDRELTQTMESLKKERYISSYSWLVSEAILFYLQEKGKNR